MMDKTVIDTLNRERGVEFVLVSGSVYEGTVKAREKKVMLQIDLGKGFPSSFPHIRVMGNKGFIPHASQDGKLCLFEEESVLIKPNNAEQLLLDSFDRAMEILCMTPQVKKEEVLREFASYWLSISADKPCVYTNLPEAGVDEFRELTAIGVESSNLIISENTEDARYLFENYFYSLNPKEGVAKSYSCVWIKLKSSTIPRLNTELSWEYLKGFIINNTSNKVKKQVVELLNRKKNLINQLFLLSIPSECGEQYACIWVRYRSSGKRSSLMNVTNCNVIALRTVRIDFKYMLTRGGAVSSITNKSVLLIGCGSVGGFVAENLCQCGVGMIDILDKESLTVDNVHRHVLGFSDAIKGKNKAELMKDYLNMRFIHTDVDSFDCTAENITRDYKRLGNYDLIVSATGNPTVNLVLDDALRKLDDAPPFVVCFNEPYGVGGHAIVVFKDDSLRRFYSDPISGELVPYLGSFTESNQSFSKTQAGCAGTYVEYSVLDSQQTAIITTKLALQVLQGKCIESKVVSWIGESESLTRAGYKTSAYYDKEKKNGATIITKELRDSEGV